MNMVLVEYMYNFFMMKHMVGVVQDCSNSGADAPELLQSFAKPPVWRC